MDPRFITGQYAWLKYRQILLVQEQQLLQTLMTLNSILLHEVSCDPTEKCLCHGQILMPGIGNTSKLCLEFSLDFFVLLSSVFENRPLHTGQFVLEGHVRRVSLTGVIFEGLTATAGLPIPSSNVIEEEAVSVYTATMRSWICFVFLPLFVKQFYHCGAPNFLQR